MFGFRAAWIVNATHGPGPAWPPFPLGMGLLLLGMGADSSGNGGCSLCPGQDGGEGRQSFPAQETTNHSGQQLPPPDLGLPPHPSRTPFLIHPSPIPNPSQPPFSIHHRPQANPQLPGFFPKEKPHPDFIPAPAGSVWSVSLTQQGQCHPCVTHPAQTLPPPPSSLPCQCDTILQVKNIKSGVEAVPQPPREQISRGFGI